MKAKAFFWLSSTALAVLVLMTMVWSQPSTVSNTQDLVQNLPEIQLAENVNQPTEEEITAFLAELQFPPNIDEGLRREIAASASGAINDILYKSDSCKNFQGTKDYIKSFIKSGGITPEGFDRSDLDKRCGDVKSLASAIYNRFAHLKEKLGPDYEPVIDIVVERIFMFFY